MIDAIWRRLAAFPSHVWWALIWFGIAVVTMALVWPFFAPFNTLSMVREEMVMFDRLLDAGDLAGRRAEVTRAKRDEVERFLRRVSMENLPPDEDALPWASRIISHAALQSDLDISAINQVTDVDPPWRGLPVAPRAFAPFSVRVDVEGSLVNVAKFMRTMEEDNPYVTFTSFILLDRKVDAPRRSVALIVEWPTWDDEGAAPQVRRLLAGP